MRIIVFTMPYSDPEKQRLAVNKAGRKYRAGKKNDTSFLQAEKERKAAWYQANKEKKAEAQRRYRARKKEEG